jgi:hypothetical protein
MAKHFAFDLHAAIPAAWDYLWKNNLKKRAEYEAKYPDGDFGKYGRRWYTQTFYICAVDVVAQVRSFAYETAKGLKWGTNGVRGPDYGIRLSGDVEGTVRTWLLRTKAGHNFGRRHISGMRFRPRGAPRGPSEQDTLKEQAKPPKPRTIHFGTASAYSGGTPLCIKVQHAKQDADRKARGLQSAYRGWSRSKACVQNRWGKGEQSWEQNPVNCPRCLKLKDHPLAKTKEAA